LLKEKLKNLPKTPGCYLMKNKFQEVIYVGKASNLYNRVKSYFCLSHDTKTSIMVQEIVDFDYILTQNPLEALILECNLIKKYKPKFNVILKDDKNYPYIKLTNETHPRLEITRKILKDKAKYFGPYPHASAAQHIKKMLDRMFPLRKCKNLPKKVCLYYHLGQCLAPCQFKVYKEQYLPITKGIISFLNGDFKDIKNDLKLKMQEAASKLQFEKAKEYRDLIRDIDILMEKQHVALNDLIDIDIFAFKAFDGFMSIQVFLMRQGKLLEKETVTFSHYNEAEEDFVSFIALFYHKRADLPREVVLPSIKEENLLLLSTVFKNIKFVIPKKGVKKELVSLAYRNAVSAFEEYFKKESKDSYNKTEPLRLLSNLLGIGNVCHIEAFDNSNTNGVDKVSAMVVFKDGRPFKKGYRKFKIRTVEQKDDAKMFSEVIRRRYQRVLKEKLPLPDLILVDGGKIQVREAKKVLEDELGLFIPVVGMVKDKKHKTSYLTTDSETFHIKNNKLLYKFICYLQEEVHRFAISFHRNLRAKTSLNSSLDLIKGIGAKRKRLLYNYFGSLDKIKNASLQELQKAGLPLNVAKNVLDFFKK